MEAVPLWLEGGSRHGGGGTVVGLAQLSLTKPQGLYLRITGK